jgi:hypothetical protein
VSVCVCVCLCVCVCVCLCACVKKGAGVDLHGMQQHSKLLCCSATPVFIPLTFPSGLALGADLSLRCSLDAPSLPPSSAFRFFLALLAAAAAPSSALRALVTIGATGCTGLTTICHARRCERDA